MSHARDGTREETLAHLLSALRDPEASEVALVAPAGSGKHSLVRSVLTQPVTQPLFPDGVVWFEGDHPHPWLLNDTLNQRCAALHPRSVREGSLQWLRSARALVVVSVGAAQPSVADELRSLANPRSSRILWLRERATPQDSRVIALPPLTESEALELFREGSAVSELTPSLTALVTNCAGSPLSLRLLAGLARMLGSERLPSELGAIQPLTPASLLGHAWRACTPSEQQALLWASHFPQFFRGALALAAGFEVSDWSALAARGWCESTGEGQWRLPASVRQFLSAPEQHQAATASFAAWSAFLHQELERGMTVGFDNIAVGAGDLAGLWAYSLKQRTPDVWRHHSNLVNQWARSTRNLLLSHDWHQAVLANLDADPNRASLATSEQHRSRAQLMFAIAFSLNHLQQLEAANDLAEAGLAHVDGDPILRSEGLTMKAASAFHRNRFAEAIALFREALASLPPDDDNPLRGANLLADIAQARLMQGELDGAETALREAIALKQRSRRAGLALPNVNALGLLLIALERIDEALEVLHDGVQQGRRLRNRNVLPYLLHSLALAELEARHPERAYRLAAEAYSRLDSRLHEQVTPLLQTTLCRTMAQAPGVNLAASDVRTLLARCWPLAGGVAWYASLAVIDYLAFEVGRGEAAGELAQLLAAAAHEGHLNTIIRRTLARLQPAGPPPTQPPSLADMRSVIARLAPELITA
jgi:tetratricopeptide (TPR) repeat protein